jgi:hypothetical protein
MDTRAAQPYEPVPTYPDIPARQGFQHARTSIGAGSAGHWVKMAGILSPLIIGELVHDPDKRWRLIRISSVATALIAEGIWQTRQRQRKQEHEHCR